MKSKNNLIKTDHTNKTKYGMLELAILHILCQGDLYGLEFTDLISEMTGGSVNVPIGSIYPILYQLVDAGYVSSTSDPKRKTRTYYHIEDSGRQRLEFLTKDYLKTNDAIQSILAYQSSKTGANS